MRSVLLLCVALLLAAPARAELCARWESADTTRGLTASGLIFVDWMQTRQFVADRKDGLQESNPLLGPDPSPERINQAAALALLALWGGSCVFEDEGRWLWQALFIAAESYAVFHNAALGATFSF